MKQPVDIMRLRMTICIAIIEKVIVQNNFEKNQNFPLKMHLFFSQRKDTSSEEMLERCFLKERLIKKSVHYFYIIFYDIRTMMIQSSHKMIKLYLIQCIQNIS